MFRSEKMPMMTGARLLAETVYGYDVDHVFFMPFIAPRALMEMEKLGIKRVQTHGEKSAAYMADAYARVKRGPGLSWRSRWALSTWPRACKTPGFPVRRSSPSPGANWGSISCDTPIKKLITWRLFPP